MLTMKVTSCAIVNNNRRDKFVVGLLRIHKG